MIRNQILLFALSVDCRIDAGAWDEVPLKMWPFKLLVLFPINTRFFMHCWIMSDLDGIQWMVSLASDLKNNNWKMGKQRYKEVASKEGHFYRVQPYVSCYVLENLIYESKITGSGMKTGQGIHSVHLPFLSLGARYCFLGKASLLLHLCTCTSPIYVWLGGNRNHSR